MGAVYNIIICEKEAIISDLLSLYSESGGTKAIEKSINKTKNDADLIDAKKDKLLELVVDGRISNEEFEKRNNDFNIQLQKLNTRLEVLEKEKKESVDFKKRVDALRTGIEKELCFNEDVGKNVIESLVDKIIVHNGKRENEIVLKFYLNLLPGKMQNFTESQQTFSFNRGQIIQKRGGNSKVLKEYDVIFNYELCYSPK